MTGIVVSIFVAEEAGAPMRALDRARLLPAIGIEGDRYATGRGHWSDPKWPDQEITFVEAEVANDLGLEPHQLRRNIVTRHIALGSLIGHEFSVGEARLFGVRPCDPCKYIERFTRPGLLALLAGRGGLRAKILSPAEIRPGDPILPLSLSEHVPQVPKTSESG